MRKVAHSSMEVTEKTIHSSMAKDKDIIESSKVI